MSVRHLVLSLFSPLFAIGLCAQALAQEEPAPFVPEDHLSAEVSSATEAALLPAGYETLVHQAIAAQVAGDFEGAHRLFTEAHALNPNARTLRGMGVASFQARHYARALLELDAALVHPNKPLDAALRPAVEALRARANAEVGVWILRVEPAEARVAVDAQEAVASDQPLVLDPGMHQLTLTADGFVEQRIEISVMPGTRGPIEVRLAPVEVAQVPVPAPSAFTNSAEPPPAIGKVANGGRPHRRRLLASISMLGLSGAAGLTSAALAVSARSRIDDIARTCREKMGGECSPEQASRLKSDANILTLQRSINASLGVAGAALAAAGVLFTWDYLANDRKLDLRISLTAVSVQTRF